MSCKMFLAMAVVSTAAFAGAQSTPAAQQAAPPQNLQAKPPTQGTPPPPPPPANSQQGLTPPIEPKTSVAKNPPNVDVPPPPGGGAPVNKPLTAEEAAQIALKNLPAIGIAMGQWVEARGVLVTQAAALYPQLSASQNYARQETLHGNSGSVLPSVGGTTGTGGTGTGGTGTGGTGTTGSNGSGTTATTKTGSQLAGYSGGVVLNQLVFDFNHTRDLVREDNALAKSAQQTYTKAQIDAIYQVKNQFYTFAQNEELVQVQQANVDSAQAALDLAQASLDAGLGAPADVINARTTLANDISALIQAEATATTSRFTLCVDMGVDPRTPIVPDISTASTEPDEPTSDVNTMVMEALQQRPDILAAILQIRVRQGMKCPLRGLPVLRLSTSRWELATPASGIRLPTTDWREA